MMLIINLNVTTLFCFTGKVAINSFRNENKFLQYDWETIRSKVINEKAAYRKRSACYTTYNNN